MISVKKSRKPLFFRLYSTFCMNNLIFKQCHGSWEARCLQWKAKGAGTPSIILTRPATVLVWRRRRKRSYSVSVFKQFLQRKYPSVCIGKHTHSQLLFSFLFWKPQTLTNITMAFKVSNKRSVNLHITFSNSYHSTWYKYAIIFLAHTAGYKVGLAYSLVNY